MPKQKNKNFKITAKDILIPLDVPAKMKATFCKNYLAITKRTGNLMLFAGDQKIEHQNYDFYGKSIDLADNNPEHLFQIASQGKIGVFASQLGLISRYGHKYKTIPYLIKLNSKSNYVKTKQAEPYSELLNSVEDVVEFKKNSKLNILAVGYTLYLGSEKEAEMLSDASWIIREAHKNGLIAVIWIYPRGKAIKNELDPNIIAGATGTAVCLGADFVKVNYPKMPNKKSAEIFEQAIESAGNTKVICSGGPTTDIKTFLQTLHDQIHISGTYGNATGRNIHQKDLKTAIKMTKAIATITLKGKTVEQALKLIK